MVFIFKLNIKVVYHLFFFFAVKKKTNTAMGGNESGKKILCTLVMYPLDNLKAVYSIGLNSAIC